MRRAIALASERVGQTAPNPAVGCVLVRDGEVVGEGATGVGGRPHAEEAALLAGGAEGATAYVTLEPCGARSGGGVSCAERLVLAGVGAVAIGCEDPSPYASGQGIRLLQAGGVAVAVGVLEAEAKALVADWLAAHAEGPR